MRYSQNNEEEIIGAFFGSGRGRFLDVGAYNGITFSNTRALALAGWSGVCVEASPLAFAALVETYRDRPDVACELAALTPEKDGPVQLWETPDCLSTTTERNRAIWDGYTAFRAVTVAAMSIASLLARHPGPYDLVSIDTEGTSVDLALALPWGDLGARCVCVEHDGEHARLARELAGHGFRVAGRTSENIILVRV